MQIISYPQFVSLAYYHYILVTELSMCFLGCMKGGWSVLMHVYLIITLFLLYSVMTEGTKKCLKSQVTVFTESLKLHLTIWIKKKSDAQ